MVKSCSPLPLPTTQNWILTPLSIKPVAVIRDIDDMNVLIMKPNGSFITVNDDLDDNTLIGPGDEIFVLSKPDEKGFQFAKDITQIIFQIAMSAAVVLAI